ncbi:ABC transporter ATP-binding protein [Lactobacillus sp. PV037]|uniref:ATP-binding cassette domain-containing protein n=1 Tax=unclassified Lactobacillus TaxID=2620435 RepID=UPI00223F4A8E|nr:MULTISPECIES: ABC transporter ATP-binding protein [unclassified Lactobacillus]QNQ82042.1 ABC transporter ATP-binding protein [Lactobacillus sp. PV012]QNQ83923.1 ABC transporter ATP-binding protein [Lactobacillus sp. PV037]
MIKYDHIGKKYGDQVILEDISFQVNKGELFVIVGPSGSGKTTLLKMYNRLVEPTSGKILSNGENIAQINLRTLRKNAGYVLQSASLFPNLTVGENITIALDGKISKEEKINLQKELLKLVKMSPEKYLSRYPTDLSGGEQQRVGIARALATKPPVILMDESFSALDPVVRKQLQDTLLELHKQTSVTIMFVTHDMQEAVRLGDRIAVIHQGHLEQIGKPREILHHPATKFVKKFFAASSVENNFDLEGLLKGELGVDPRFYPKTETLLRYHISNLKDLVKACSNHPDTLFIAETEFGEFLIEPKRVWKFLLQRVVSDD